MKVISTDYLPLVAALITDCGEKCSTKWCSKDVKTVRLRVKHEGMSFLTITLPSFSSSFFHCLEKGFVDSTDFIGWKRSARLPAFLQGFTSQVFDQSTGRILNEPNKWSIKSVRQICNFFKKIRLTCDPDRVTKAYSDYVDTDSELARHIFPMQRMEVFKAISRVVVSSIFPRAINGEDLIPHHGPGSTAEKIVGNKKYEPKHYPWFRQLDTVFSDSLVRHTTEETYSDSVQMTTSDDPVVRVIDVPKTLTKPRIIALEPVSMQMTQQSIKDYMVREIEHAKITAGHVNFSDQSINKNLALTSSQTRALATVDLSAASDRVHNDLVKALFEVNPSLSCLIQRTRSPKADVRGTVMPLAKFASMGSALCFPVEAMVFYCLVILGRLEHKGVHPSNFTFREIFDLTRNVYVYGDDILFPVDEVDAVFQTFTSFGLKVSESKSFWRGHFRESCGMDAYDGTDVTPVYLREPLQDSKFRPNRITSHVSTVNQLRAAHLDRTATILKTGVESRVGNLPTKRSNTEGLGWVGQTKGKTRFNRNYQRLEVQTLVPVISSMEDEITGYPALHKCLLKLTLGGVPELREDTLIYIFNKYIGVSFDQRTVEEHLCRTPRRGALTLKRRWVAA